MRNNGEENISEKWRHGGMKMAHGSGEAYGYRENNKRRHVAKKYQ